MQGQAKQVFMMFMASWFKKLVPKVLLSSPLLQYPSVLSRVASGIIIIKSYKNYIFPVVALKLLKCMKVLAVINEREEFRFAKKSIWPYWAITSQSSIMHLFSDHF